MTKPEKPKASRSERLVQDTREQCPLVFTRHETVVAGLDAMDYAVEGYERFLRWERKSLDDLCGSLGQGRTRFMRMWLRVRQVYPDMIKVLVIEGTKEDVLAHRYRSQIHPNSIMGTLAALRDREGVHIVWAGGPVGAAAEIERHADNFLAGWSAAAGDADWLEQYSLREAEEEGEEQTC